MNQTALIGHTGFVGSNLKEQIRPEGLYNSRNIESLKGKHYGRVVCAGVSAVKWKANKDPESDWAGIQSLLDVLKTLETDHFILISTIDVYPLIRDCDEYFDCHSMENHAYGEHRLKVEDFCRNQFANCTIIRLPGLFGKSLKKNVIFDLLHDNCLEMINPASTIQYYDLSHLWADIEKTIQLEIPLINLFTEPVSSEEILERFFPNKRDQVGRAKVPEVHYALKTKHAQHWDGADGYIYNKRQILDQMDRFIRSQLKESN